MMFTVPLKSILMGCAFYQFQDDNILFGCASFAAFFFSFTPKFLHTYFGITFPRIIDFFISLGLVIHIFFGEFMDFHRQVYMFDKGMHFFNTALITLIAFFVISSLYPSYIESSFSFMMTLVIMIAIAIGTFWEIAEFSADQWFHIQSQDGLEDTMWDMISNFGGALLSVTGITLYTKRKTPIYENTQRKRKI